MKHKLIITLLLVGSSFADQKSSLYVFHNGWHELNPIYGSTPSTARFVATHSAIDAAQIIALWNTKGRLHKVAVIMALWSAANNSAATIHNYELPKHP